jgi:hypothetical protein
MDSSFQGPYPLASRSQTARYLPCLKVSGGRRQEAEKAPFVRAMRTAGR